MKKVLRFLLLSIIINPRLRFILFLIVGQELLIINVFAQAPLVKQWDYRFGGSSDDYLQCIQHTRDGGFILGGWSSSGISGDKSQASQGSWDYWIVKTDSLGIKQWDKDFGGIGYDELFSIQQTSDGGFILGGYSSSGISGDKSQASWGGYDYWIVKMDALGNKLWDRDFGGTGDDELFSIQPTLDGGFILGGYSASGIGGDKSQATWVGSYDYWIVKTDSIGNKQWDKDFGGTSDDYLFSIRQTSDGGFILGGWSESGINGDKSQASWGLEDYWIVKTDSLGNKLWDKDFGGGSEDYLFSIQQTADGGFILGGFSLSGISGDKSQWSWGGYDYWIIKTDALGNKLWDKDFGGTDNEEEFGNIGNISQTSDGGFLLAGSSYSGISGDKTEDNLGEEQSWIVKTDSLGNKVWDKTLLTTGHDEAGYVVETSERGCYLTGNFTNGGIGGDKTQATQGSYDYWIIKFCDTSLHCNLFSPTVNANQTVFCATDSAQICAQSGFQSYLWNTGASTQCINSGLAGNYYVTVTDNSGCTAASNHIAITVLPSPPVSISVNGDTLTAYNATTYQWYLNGNSIGGANQQTYIATQGGSYTVAVTDTNGCSAVSTPVIINGIGSPLPSGEGLGVRLSPNPATNHLHISITSPFSNYTYQIFNPLGELLTQNKTTNKEFEIDISPLSPGMYFIKFKNENTEVVKKFVKE